MKVYLETSFVSACVTTRIDPSSVYRKKESLEWWESERRKHVLLVSDEVLVELGNPTYPSRADALNFIRGVPVLPVNDQVLGLARIFVDEQVMPQPLGGDAVHVAVATLAHAEYILSWNVRHLANPNKRLHLAKTCMRLGLIPPIIVTPESLWEE
jgi:hypothetical protein